jgi:predicted RNase H-like HicB family nuclease
MVMSETLHLTIRYEDGEQGWITASIPQVPGALSQGHTQEEARANVLDALRLLLSPEPGERGESESLELTIGS